MRARDLLPWRDFTIETSCTPQATHDTIDRLCEHSALYGRSTDAPFAGGSTARGAFELHPNDEQPTLVGVVARVVVVPGHACGAQVRVAVGLPWRVAACLPFLAAPVLIDVFTADHRWLVAAVPLTAMALALLIASFRHEAGAVEQTLRSAFAEAPGVPAPPETGVPFR
jgi:hypothetical protein